MKVPDTKENMMKCICPKCPSFNQCMKDKPEGFFCAKGKASCEFSKKGCICGECPLTAEFGLTNFYYCEIGVSE